MVLSEECQQEFHLHHVFYYFCVIARVHTRGKLFSSSRTCVSSSLFSHLQSYIFSHSSVTILCLLYLVQFWEFATFCMEFFFSFSWN